MRRGAGIPLCHSHYRVIPACLQQAGRSGTVRRGSSNSPPLEGCPPGRGGRAAPACSRQVWNKRPRRERPGGEGLAGLAKCPHPVVTPVVIPATRKWIIKPLDSSLRWNDGRGLRSGVCQAWQRGCRDGNPPVPSSSSFRPACSRQAQAGIQWLKQVIPAARE